MFIKGFCCFLAGGVCGCKGQ